MYGSQLGEFLIGSEEFEGSMKSLYDLISLCVRKQYKKEKALHVLYKSSWISKINYILLSITPSR